MNLKLSCVLFLIVTITSVALSDSVNDAINGAREAIVSAESYVNVISDEEDMNYIVSILSVASTDWEVALKDQEAVQLCLNKKEGASGELQSDYNILMKVSAQSAEVHANSVRLAAAYVQLIAQKAQENLLENVRIAIKENEKIKQLVSDNVEYTKRQVASKYR
ncbi:MAG: hypothetical protein CBE26_01015 [Kiritimatiellaceae bacterium TMED266]|nr:MAG: hypothetical protein CBE26_01015 [Kiritimatiellaceae bacterium TMED266]